MVEEPKRPVWKTTLTARDNARRLRRDMTDAERTIWNDLRAHRLNGASFRRQKPIGPYIVDFICETANLIIEIDGGQHYEPPGIEKDAQRDRYLAFEGYNVLRFSNHDVLTNKAGVLETITTALQAKAPSLTSPASGRAEDIEGGEPS
jgi:very-short-patch-repair endonuclease